MQAFQLLKNNLYRFANFFELFAIIVILFFAFGFQFFLHELPCPLCLLQRAGFLLMAYGFLLNFRFGFNPTHYSIVILSGLFTAFVALRQIALHVVPGSGAYGSTIFGLHLYTWSFIAVMVIVTVTAFLLGMPNQYIRQYKNKIFQGQLLTHILFGIITIVIIANIFSIFFECGLAICPDEPIQYKIINDSIKV